jgi:hypothetical protein
MADLAMTVGRRPAAVPARDAGPGRGRRPRQEENRARERGREKTYRPSRNRSSRPSLAKMFWPSRGERIWPSRVRPCRPSRGRELRPSQGEMIWPSRGSELRPSWDSALCRPSRDWKCRPSRVLSLFRPGKVYSGLGLVNPAQAAVYLLFNIPTIYNLIYNVYISHNKGVLWYTRGYIPDTQVMDASDQCVYCGPTCMTAFTSTPNQGSSFGSSV